MNQGPDTDTRTRVNLQWLRNHCVPGHWHDAGTGDKTRDGSEVRQPSSRALTQMAYTSDGAVAYAAVGADGTVVPIPTTNGETGAADPGRQLPDRCH
ncbi:hypothetical protein GCM10022232_25960 [Streptomyces plumbiresistens]|uniref:Uncharacterized protein n=1 Tax=Streptomyces plumbiresistens TaxID=511811 RepID=A0ABP7R0T6_9ACTN